ncbi:DUF308 domain-containing protein [Sandarakinorhabdus sp.]|uniref:HdeD family acid-resistance protein n=1 Tax=Sandarakinorhabdus sp. TaxID=1916663 RepID=UPI0033407DD1
MGSSTDIPLPEPGADSLNDRMAKSSGAMLWLGAAMVGLGIAAIIFPNFATLAAEQFVGWMLLFLGLTLLFGSFSILGTGPFFGALLVSLFALFGAMFLIVNPAVGALTLTLMAGGIFLFQGITEIALAIAMRPKQKWGGMLLSGLASLLLAVLIFVGWPAISLSVLGILFGVNFISTGIAYILIARQSRRAA